MKTYVKTIGLAAILSLVVVSGFAAETTTATGTGGSMQAICDLVKEFNKIFQILRVFAFVGAAYMMAKWAWDFISAGDVKDPVGEVKTKGLSLLVGTALLFGVGVIITLLLGTVGGASLCAEELRSIGSGAAW